MRLHAFSVLEFRRKEAMRLHTFSMLEFRRKEAMRLHAFSVLEFRRKESMRKVAVYFFFIKHITKIVLVFANSHNYLLIAPKYITRFLYF